MNSDGPAGGRGKWSEANVPHKGWVCVDIEDLGEPNATCEMCESSSIRYVHYMQNERYSGTLRCGCVCAGHMEEDLLGAQEREKGMRSRAGKRKRWPDLAGWKRARSGNVYIIKDGYRSTVFMKDGQLMAAVVAPWRERPYYVTRGLSTVREAQLATFDKITQLERRREGTPFG